MSELIDRQAAIVEIAKLQKIVPYYFPKEKPSEAYFNEGLHAAMGIIQSQPSASPWHRVEDGLPEVGEYVLTWEWGKFAIVDKWCGDKWGLTESGAEYTHWMPLPEPPKEDNDG